MREVFHKYILAGFAALITGFFGYCIGFVNALNWVIKTAVTRFGLQIGINYAELASAIFRYQHAVG